MEKQHLYGLASYDFIHPADRVAMNTVEKIPGFDLLTKFIVENSIEVFYNIMLKGSSIKITSQNAPRIISIFQEVADNLEVSLFPDIYLERGYQFRNHIIGYKNPIVLLQTNCVDKLSDERLFFIAGRCMSGIKAGHNKFEFFSDVISNLSEMIPFGIANALQLPLLQWKRKAELSRDRGGLLACQNYEEAMRTLMLYAGVPYGMEQAILIDDFVGQAVEFKSKGGIEKLGRLTMTAFNNSAWTVERAAELFNWYETGQYENVILRHT